MHHTQMMNKGMPKSSDSLQQNIILYNIHYLTFPNTSISSAFRFAKICLICFCTRLSFFSKTWKDLRQLYFDFRSAQVDGSF